MGSRSHLYWRHMQNSHCPILMQAVSSSKESKTRASQVLIRGQAEPFFVLHNLPGYCGSPWKQVWQWHVKTCPQAHLGRACQHYRPGAHTERRGIAPSPAPWTPPFECPGTGGLCRSSLQHNARASRSFLQHRWWIHTKSHPSRCFMCLCSQMKRKATTAYASSALPPHPCWRGAP